MAIPENVLLEMEGRINSGENTIDQMPPAARQEYLDWVSSKEAPSQEAVSPDAPQEEGLLTKGLGALETVATFGSGLVSQPISGLAGLGRLAMGGSLDDAVNTIQDVSGDLTYQPRTQAGKSSLEAIGTIVEPVERLLEGAGQLTTDVTGSPLMGAGVRTLLEVGPTFFGVKNPVSVARTSRAGINQARTLFKEAGIDVSPSLLESISIRGIPRTGKVAEIINKVPEAAAALSRSTQVKGQDLLNIQKGVRSARKATKEAIGMMYDQALEAGVVRVPTNQVKILNQSLANALAGFEMANAQPVRNLLSQFTSLIEPSAKKLKNITVSRRGIGSTELSRDINVPEMTTGQLKKAVVELNDISKFRRKLSAAEIGNNAEVSAAASVMKKGIDDWMTAQFDADMMSGSADAIAKWKNANSAYKEYSNIFKENKAMEMIFSREATPEAVHKWIFGASAVGAKAESALVAKRLNQVLGKNSAEMQTLRNSAAFDMVYPLLRDNFDPKGISSFRRNYVDFVKKNDSLAKELFSADQLKSFDTLSKIISSAKNLDLELPSLINNIDRTLAIALLPTAQPLAKGQAIINIAMNGIKRIKSLATGANRKAAKDFYSNLLGFDVGQPLVRKRTPAIASFIQVAQQQPDQFDRLYDYLTTGNAVVVEED